MVPTPQTLHSSNGPRTKKNLPHKFEQHDQHGIEHGSDKDAPRREVEALVGVVNKGNGVGQQTKAEHHSGNFVVGHHGVEKIAERGAGKLDEVHDAHAQHWENDADDKS